MAHHEINLSDTSSFEDDPGGSGIAPYRETYEVVRPLFKRGEEHEPGSMIDLDPDTAARFLELGDIKEVSK